MMIGRESFLEFYKNEDSLVSGSFEYMKYKLWSQLTGSDRSACHYAILEVERIAISLPPFPCPLASTRASRIFEGQIADYYPFFVVINWNTFNGGVILSPEYVMIYGSVTPSKVAYGIEPGQNYAAALSGPNVVNVVQNIYVAPGLSIVKVSPPITFGPLASAALLSDCSGPSNPQLGQDVAFYGMGRDETGSYPDSVMVGCGQVIAPTASCDFDVGDRGFSYSLCLLTNACTRDWGGPIMAKGPDGYYLAAIIHRVNSCSGKSLVLVFFHIFFVSPMLLGIYDRAQPSVCQFYTEIQSIINS